MPDSGIFLDYHGPLDFSVIDFLLNDLKKTNEYNSFNKTTAKRVYAIVVECLENICKHSEVLKTKDPEMLPYLTLRLEDEKVIVSAGNAIDEFSKKNITDRIDHLNNSNGKTLVKLYEDKIKSDLEENDKCAGLGFIYMALKSGNRLRYSFSNLANGYSYFEIYISINKYKMKKLFVDQKSNSPKVILDPESRVYLISGESRPPDVREFYGPVIDWLDEFSMHMINSKKTDEPVIFNFDYEYFNSSSGKLILDICKMLAGLHNKGVNVVINWHFEKEDYDMFEAGKEISRIVKFPFEFIESNN